MGDYSKSYNFLLNGIKRLENIRNNSEVKQTKINKKHVVSLSKLRSNRYESKVIFSSDFISKFCPVYFFEELNEKHQTDIIFNIKFLIAVCNKFLQKPFPSSSLLLDIVSHFESESGAYQKLEKREGNTLNQIIEGIGFDYLGDSPKQAYTEIKSKLLDSKLMMLCYGELAILSLYNEKYADSLYYVMLYSNYNNDDVSLNVVLEVMIGLWDKFDERTRQSISQMMESLADIAFEKFQANYEKVQGEKLVFQAYQQLAFLGSFLEYKIKRLASKNKFLSKLESYSVLLDHSDDTDNNVLTYNLGVLNEDESNPLCAYFSLNYNSWMQYFLRLGETSPTSNRIAALLISLNLNFDNQMCWNLLSRYMLKNGYLKFSLQAYLAY